MRTLAEVRDRCRIDELTGCWVWTGARSAGLPRIYAPNADGRMQGIPARRALWLMLNPGKVLPAGWRVWGTCDCVLCVNPEHARAGDAKAWGRHTSRSGKLLGDITRKVKARQSSQARSVLTPELIAQIQASSETGEQLAARLGVARSTISRARCGQVVCFEPVGGLFSGLMA